MVRSFQLHIVGDEFERSVAVRLGCALVMMVRLEHLFLRIPSNIGVVSYGIEFSHFHLKTLCLSQSIPLPTWILDGTRLLTLKVLGIYDSYFYTSPSTLAVYERLIHATPADDPLVIFGLGYYGSPGYSNITIFPALFMSKIGIQKFDRIVRALDRMGAECSSFTDFHIYVASTSGEEAGGILRDTFQFISQWFWQVLCISLRFSDPDIHILPSMLTTAVSLVPALMELHVSYWDVALAMENFVEVAEYQRQRHALASVWSRGSSNLICVRFPDDVPLNRNKRTGIWE